MDEQELHELLGHPSEKLTKETAKKLDIESISRKINVWPT